MSEWSDDFSDDFGPPQPYSYGYMQRQIADELGDRQDLLVPLPGSALALSPIQHAIQAAIAKWQREPFYFNEVYSQGSFNTVAGQEFYTSDDVPEFVNLPYIQQVRVVVNANRYTLVNRTWQYIEEIMSSPSVNSSLPYDFAYFAGTLRFYPTPNAVIPVTLMANTRLSPLVNNRDSNAWTTEAFDLIRSEAKMILALEVLQDDETAARSKAAIYGVQGVPGYLYGLYAETSRRGGGGRIIPSQF